MRAGIPPQHFFQRMKKKPALQAILDNLMSYSEDELSRIQGQPLWIREQLVMLRKNGGQSPLTPEQIADLMTVKPQPVVPDPIYTVVTLDKDVWVDTGRNSLATLIPEGSLVLIVSEEAVMFGYTDLKMNRTSYDALWGASLHEDTTTRELYKQAYQQRVNKTAA